MATRTRTASLTHESSNGREGFRLRFYDRHDKRRSLWLGPVSEHAADTWKKHVEHLADCSRLNDPPSPVSTRWLAGLSAGQREKLERVELVDANEATLKRKQARQNSAPNRLGAFLEWYIANHSAKPRTLVKWRQGRDCLLRFFKSSQKLDSITTADALRWRNWLANHGNIREGKERTKEDGKKVRGRESLAEATVRRRTGQARQFFNFAVKARLIAENPFSELPATVHGNDERAFFVSREMASRMLEHAPGAEWEAIIALSRYGGVRAPSETMRLRWEDIDLANRRMKIHAPKTEHHKNKGIRYCPIFPELLPYLETLAELAKHRGAKPTDFVISQPRGSESVLRPGMLRILDKAGIPVYPKLFQNLRASRETELMDEFPIKDVCAWIGNSPKVAMEHYAMRREDSFARAAGLDRSHGGPDGGPSSGDSRQLPATADQPSHEPEASFDPEKTGSNALLATCGNAGQNGKDRPARTRKACETPRECATVAERGPDGGPQTPAAVTSSLDTDTEALPNSGRMPDTLVSLREMPLTLAEIEASFSRPDDGYTPARSTLHRRLMSAGVPPVDRPGLATAAYRRADVEAALFQSDGLIYRPKKQRSFAMPESEWDAKLLEAGRDGRDRDPKEQLRLLRLIRAFWQSEEPG